jgi:hypothetical protein
MGMTGDHITLPLFYPLNNGQQIRNYLDLKTRALPIWTTFCQKVVGKKSKVLNELLFEIRMEARQYLLADAEGSAAQTTDKLTGGITSNYTDQLQQIRNNRKEEFLAD